MKEMDGGKPVRRYVAEPIPDGEPVPEPVVVPEPVQEPVPA
jgi:hypothetical protein